MKRLLICLLLLVASIALGQDYPKGAYDGVTVRIENARISNNGKIIVITAVGTGDTTGSFVLGCNRHEEQCFLPRVNATYRVISRRDGSTESWGLLPTNSNHGLVVADLLYVQAK